MPFKILPFDIETGNSDFHKITSESNSSDVIQRCNALKETLSPLEFKEAINRKNNKHETPLFLAIKDESYDLAEWLILNGAVIVWDDLGRKNVFYAAVTNESDDERYLHLLAKHCHPKLLGKVNNELDKCGCHLLFYAIENCYPKKAEWLLKNGADFDWYDSKNVNYNLMHVAVKENTLPCLQLLKKYAPVFFRKWINQRHVEGLTPLASSLKYNLPDISEWLIENGAHLDWHSSDDEFGSLLHLAALWASKRGNAATILEVLKRHFSPEAFNHLMHQRNKDGHTPLAVAILHDQAEAVEWLINNGADITWRDPNNVNFSLFHLAAKSQALHSLKVLRRLYPPEDLVAAINAVDAAGHSALSLAVEKDSPKIVLHLLVEMGASLTWCKFDNEDFTLIHVASCSGANEALSTLKELYSFDHFNRDINKVCSDGNTPLSYAVTNKRSYTVTWLIKNGASVIWYGQPYCNLSHLAATHGQLFYLTEKEDVLPTDYFKVALQEENAQSETPLELLFRNLLCSSALDVEWVIDNNHCTGSKKELDAAAIYFTDLFKRQVYPFGLQSLDTHSAHLNLFLKYLQAVEDALTSESAIPPIFQRFRELTQSYALFASETTSKSLNALRERGLGTHAISTLVSKLFEEYLPSDELVLLLSKRNTPFRKYCCKLNAGFARFYPSNKKAKLNGEEFNEHQLTDASQSTNSFSK